MSAETAPRQIATPARQGGNAQAASTVPRRASMLEHLPLETLQAIMCHVDASTLLKLQTVSTRYHSLASAEIYRSLHFNITCSETDETGEVASRAADALQTINTSDYNYAQHVKSFRLGYNTAAPWSSGLYLDSAIPTRTVFDSSSDASKFLNTSILQMVRKATILETFKWDIPVELSGHVYRALQKLSSLSHLYVRLDVGPAPKPTPRSANGLNYYPPPPPIDSMDTVLPNNPSIVGHKHSNQKRKKRPGSTFWTDQRAFSGFTFLNTLEITRLTGLDGLSELRQCIKACSASLRSLTLTIDSRFGAKTHRSTLPPPPNDFDSLSDTEPEDDEIIDNPVSHTADQSEADRRQEKVALEGVLASLFDLQGSAARGQKLERKMGLTGGKCLIEEDKSATIQTFENLIKSLRDEEAANGSTSLSVSARLEKYKMMRELADLYISQHAPRAKKLPKPEIDGISTTKKPFKASKYKAPTYPPPMPATDYLLDDFDFETFAHENGSLSSPMSVESALGSSNTKPWSTYPSKYPQPGANYLLDPLPPLPPTSGVGSSLNPPGPLSPPVLTAHINQPQFVPYSSSAQQPNVVKPSPFSSQDMPGHPSSHLPYTISYSENATNLYGKPSKSKNKPTYKSSNAKNAALLDKYSHLYYDGALTNGKTLPKAPHGTGFSTSMPSKTAPKPNPKTKFVDYSDQSSTDSSSISDADSDKSSIIKPQGSAPFFAAEPTEGLNDGIDVDMEHPDEDDAELIEDQATTSETDSAEIHTPRKRLKPFATLEPQDSGLNHETSDGPSTHGTVPPREQNDTDKMQDYIRITHGIQLETFRLQYVPLKASVIGRALDLQSLQHITLLETGPQDAFWALLVKLTSVEAPISFKSIHTDHVSFSFLKFISTFSNLEELFMHERRSKNKDADSAIDVDVKSMRKQALRPHVISLKRLMIRNERNDTWDLDFKTLHMLAMQAKNLQELAINLKSHVYHGLLQILPAFKSLRALHLIALRGGDRNSSMQFESLAYTIDSLMQCADLRLRYIAIADRVTEISGHAQFRKHLRKMIDGHEGPPAASQKDKKGKGKAVDPLPLEMEVPSDQELDRTLARMQAAQRKLRIPRQFSELITIKVFNAEIRTGRL